jgi:hypothetical protein
MKTKILGILVVTLLIATNVAVLADWDPGDGHKMHWPQLPDEDGWDVKSSWPIVLADDWKCSESGPVEDIHFWGSYKNDTGHPIVLFASFEIAIWSDLPADESPTGYSMPNVMLWNRSFEFVNARYLESEEWEGWYEPPDFFKERDHRVYYQYNIENITNPFYQEKGKIYWLSVTTPMPEYVPKWDWGWKSSEDYWNDNAVWGNYGEWDWKELYEPPYFEHKLDLSFVITGRETISTNITIIHPRNGLYFGGTRLIRIPQIIPIPISIVLGRVTVYAADYAEGVIESEVDHVDFTAENLVGGTNAFTDNSLPYEWDWNDPPGGYVIAAVARDSSNNELANDMVLVLKFS